jgi:hypothetical protein
MLALIAPPLLVSGVNAGLGEECGLWRAPFG